MAQQAPGMDLEQPLPTQLVGNTLGWLAEYRRYPVYSRAWTRLRWRPVSVFGLGFMACVSATVAATSSDARGVGGLMMVFVQMLIPAVVGPRLAGWFRRRALPRRAEGWTIGASLAALSVVIAVGAQVLGEPVKQRVAEATGAVDAQGHRLPYRMLIGISVNDGSAPVTPGAPDDPLLHPGVVSMATLTQALIIFWLAGGLALWRWHLEGLGLQRLREEQALQQAQAARREAEMRLSVLAAQVEPHFLFNTLAGVRSAIATDPTRASDMIDRLVEYLRASIPRLREDGSLQATVGAQCEVARAYLALMHSRMSRLRFSLDVPADLRGASFPPLMLISLAENAIKHGVEPKVGAAEVRVEVTSPTPHRLRVAVLDDGVGFDDAGSGSGLGLSNIRERLAQLHGPAAALSLKARRGGGVEAAIDIPLEVPR